MPRSSTLNRVLPASAGTTLKGALAQAIAATAELCGHPISAAAASLLADDLNSFDRSKLLNALLRCRRELKAPLHVGEILARIDDGRPSPEEAWNMMPNSEAASVVWTKEMAQAWGHAQPLLEDGELQQARQVFQESYAHAVLMARCQGEAIAWMASLGTDPVQREQVLRDAVSKERLPATYVEQLLPYRSLSPQAHQLLTQVRIKNVP